jgi:hypothetical protein
VTVDDIGRRLIPLYQAMADMTRPECDRCVNPHHCCDSMYCEHTIEYAREKWGVELERTGHPKLPLMGPDGCTAAPHLRPICAVHTCEIEKWGFKQGDRDWTERYFRLRDEISTLEWEREDSRTGAREDDDVVT